jgi:hypothetical protein
MGIAEIFANDQVTMTARVCPTLPDATGVRVSSPAATTITLGVSAMAAGRPGPAKAATRRSPAKG